MPQLRQALFAAHPHFMRIDQIAAGDAVDIQKLAKLDGSADKTPLRFTTPTGVTMDTQRHRLYVVELKANRVRRVDLE